MANRRSPTYRIRRIATGMTLRFPRREQYVPDSANLPVQRVSRRPARCECSSSRNCTLFRDLETGDLQCDTSTASSVSDAPLSTRRPDAISHATRVLRGPSLPGDVTSVPLAA